MSISFGIKAAHEQFSPKQLLEHAILAEKVGFESVWASDHFHPWAHTNAQCGFTWIWMASVGERTKTLKIGTGVTTPTFRYHPAIVAQAFATLGHLYPGRIRLGVGSGEGLNEMPLGFDWPPLKERIERLVEAVDIIRKLWRGDFVTYKGKYYMLRKAKIYTLPEKPIPIYIAALGPKMAYIAGRIGDGYYTFLAKPPEYFKNVIFPRVKEGAEDAGKNFDEMPSAVELVFSYDEDFDKAVESIKFWTGTLLPVFFKYGFYDPKEIEEHGRKVGVEAIKESWIITTDLDEVTKHAEECIEAGFKEVVFMSSSPDQPRVIELIGKKVLPYLREKYGGRR